MPRSIASGDHARTSFRQRHAGWLSANALEARGPGPQESVTSELPGPLGQRPPPRVSISRSVSRLTKIFALGHLAPTERRHLAARWNRSGRSQRDVIRNDPFADCEHPDRYTHATDLALSPGTLSGPYEITGAIGDGGMGEVYRAKDTILNRDVAIKVLPEAFAQDADRLARFMREAQVLASLNHPNIAAIYGIENRAA